MSRTRTTTASGPTPTLAGLLPGDALHAARTALGPLLDAYGNGWSDLPAELLDAVRAAQRLAQASRDVADGLTPQQARQQYAAALAAAARSGTTLPGPDRVAEAGRAADTAQHHRAALAEAHEIVLREAVHLALDGCERIVTEYLRPAHDAALEDARRSLAVYAEHGHDPETLLRSGNLPAQQAYMQMEKAAQRYRAVVRAGMTLVNRTGRVALDVQDVYAEMRNLRDYKPDLHAPAPWPSAERDRLAWLLQHDAQLWMPTAAERDAEHRRAAAPPDESAPLPHRGQLVTG